MRTLSDSIDSRSPQVGAGPTRVYRYASSGDADQATAETVERMKFWIQACEGSPVIWAAVHQALSGLTGGGSDRAICARVWEYLAATVTLTRDEALSQRLLGADRALELLITPDRLLTMDRPQGDCDDFTMAAAAMLLTVGVPVEVITIAADPDEPGRFSHVYLEASPAAPDGTRSAMAIDASHGQFPGWEAPYAFRRRGWGVMRPAHERPPRRLHGLGRLASGLGEDTPWWQSALDTGLNIAEARYAVPPAGTYIQTPQGVISRGAPGSVTLPPSGVQLSAGGLSGTAMVVGLAAAAALIFVLKGRR